MIGALDAPAPVRPLDAIDHLLRDRAATIARIREGIGLAPTLRAMAATIVVATAIVGAALGSFRGGVQIAYAAVKLPAVLLGAAALSAPVLTAVGAALGRPARLASDLVLVTTAVAFGSLLLAACTPLVLLARAIAMPYHDVILCIVAMFALAGIASLSLVARAVRAAGGPGGLTALAGLCVVFTLVGGQLAWALRPYLVRPRTPDVPFVRALEGSLYDAVLQSTDSARGIYTRPEAPDAEDGAP